MNVFVTVDDLGMAPGVNSAAEILLTADVVDRLSIMVTGSEVDRAADIARGAEIGLSVHLNCIQPPFLTAADFPSSHFEWFRKGRYLAGKVRIEWRRQIEKVLSLGLEVTGLDSHQHIHNADGLREVILDLADEFGIGLVRGAVLPDRWKNPSCFILDRLGRKLSRSASLLGIGIPDLTIGFSCSGNVSKKYLEGLSLSGGGVAELIMHPSTTPVWVSTQTDELELMRSEWFAEWLKRHS
jgi:chitin disaccharide deacetylase